MRSSLRLAIFSFSLTFRLQPDNGFEDEFSPFEEDDSFVNGPSLGSSNPLPITYELDCPLVLNKLESISHQLQSVSEKPIGGKPTAIAVSASLIAVGTVRGLVALFDRKSGRIVQFMHDKKGGRSFHSFFVQSLVV